MRFQWATGVGDGGDNYGNKCCEDEDVFSQDHIMETLAGLKAKY